jgi:hypothetical protein
LNAHGLQSAYEILRDAVIHPSHCTGTGSGGRVVLVREGMTAWIRISELRPVVSDPSSTQRPSDLPCLPMSGVTIMIAALILSLPVEVPHA